MLVSEHLNNIQLQPLKILKRGIVIKTILDFHLVHDSVKFELKKYVKLLDDELFEREWKNENISVLLKMKNKNSSWSSITKRTYGKKSLRFTHLSDGSVGIWLVQRIPFEELLNHEDDLYNFKKCVVYDDFEYELTINVSAEIKSELINRKKQQIKGYNARKQQKQEDKKIQYLCYNPKPYQGGGFSGK